MVDFLLSNVEQKNSYLFESSQVMYSCVIGMLIWCWLTLEERAGDMDFVAINTYVYIRKLKADLV